VPSAPRPPDLLAAAGRFTARHAAVLAVAAAAAGASAWTPYDAPGAPIRSDCVGYHLWTHAALTGGLSFCDYPVLRKLKAIAHEDQARGVCLNKFPPGVALLRFPVMAPLVDRRPGAPAISGAEYTASLWFSATLLVAVCALSASCARRLGARPWATNAAVLAVAFGTGLFHYGTFDGCFTHVHSAFVFGLLLWLGLRAAAGEARGWTVAASAGLGFLAILIRNTNALAVVWLVALAPWAPGGAPPSARRRRLVVPVLAGAALAAALQVAYNSWVVGRLVLSSYKAEPFLWGRPMALPVLVSYERGLFTYYPVVAVALLAALACGATRRAALAFSGLLLAYALLYGFWWSWMLGGGFGHRGFLDVVPFLVPLFAVALTRLPRPGRAAALCASAVSVCVTLELMAGYWRRTLPYQGSTRAAYWSHVTGEQSLLAGLGRSRPPM
jgi:hypothetical protein